MHYAILLLLLCAAAARADEALVIDTPLARDTVVSWTVGTLQLTRGLLPGTEPMVRVEVVALKADGRCVPTERGCLVQRVTYTGEVALTMMNGLNTANLTTNSLMRRVLDRLRTDGHLGAGTVAGTPGLPTFTPKPATPTP